MLGIRFYLLFTKVHCSKIPIRIPSGSDATTTLQKWDLPIY